MPPSWRIPGDVARVQAEETVVVLLLTGTSAPLLLSGSAAAIWSVLDAEDERTCTTGRIISELAEQYGRAPEEIADDVERFLAELEERGLLEPGS